MGEERGIDGVADARIVQFEHRPYRLRHRALRRRWQVEQVHERHPVDVQRAQLLTDEEGPAARVLRLELGGKRFYLPRAALARGARVGGVVAVFRAHARDAFGRLAAVDHRRENLQAPVPAEPEFAAQLVGETHHQRAIDRIRWHQRRHGREALGEHQDVVPAIERRLVVPGDDGAAVLAGPGDEFLVGAAGLQRRDGVVEPLDFEQGLRRLPPGARKALHEDEAQAGLLDDVAERLIVQHRFPRSDEPCAIRARGVVKGRRARILR